MNIPFRKMHGLGNDFVIIDGRKAKFTPDPAYIRAIGDRRRGVGFDQLVIIETSSIAAAHMLIFNPDGSEAGACGNATRCVADILLRESESTVIDISTSSRVMRCERTDDGLLSVDMGLPALEWTEIPLSKQCDTLNLPLSGNPVAVSMGNPHCVFFCEDAEDVYVDKSGLKIERDPLFPARTNVEFVSLLGQDHLRMRVWERGAGITQACGTGACASVVAAVRRGLTGRDVKVSLDGGDLFVEWRERDSHVLMTGPVSYVFDGVLSDRFGND